MPWSHCDVPFILDTENCPKCGFTKAEWTVEFEATRQFVLPRRKKGPVFGLPEDLELIFGPPAFGLRVDEDEVPPGPPAFGMGQDEDDSASKDPPAFGLKDDPDAARNHEPPSFGMAKDETSAQSHGPPAFGLAQDSTRPEHDAAPAYRQA